MGSLFGGTPKVETADPVLAATPKQQENVVQNKSSKTRRNVFGINDTFMRAFAEASSSGGKTTLGS